MASVALITALDVSCARSLSAAADAGRGAPAGLQRQVGLSALPFGHARCGA